ncbi:uracil-DNA glycosylase family protein [Croceicoccus gelatinilyticus]|uniref:uracil-DNA glycosylase family protein n=1 Tax=Croceicoccus gelatinilyticus TaxID=2835536 RepID=UPI001BCC5CCE|nr:uracil-DNA glycosylase family protein [Croceicoccus gelatinilyticus]MBS7671399.1 hypothetical protein [Croceicoccus gelatinilyticus]
MEKFHLAEREPVAVAIDAAASATNLDELYSAIRGYTAHPVAEREPYTPSQTSPHDNPIMVVSEKPEAEDRETGKPFSGVYGKIMRRALEEMGVDPDALHVAYAVHWAPGAEKAPNNTQIAASRPFLFREIELVKPRAILAQGRAVIDALTGYRGHITPILGQTLGFKWRETSLQAHVSWHPAYPLRFTTKHGEFIEQMEPFFERYGIEAEGTSPGSWSPPETPFIDKPFDRLGMAA